MELTIEKNLGSSVWLAHGALPLTQDKIVDVRLMVKHNASEKTVELHLDETKPTLVDGQRVLKYQNAKTEGIETVEVGQKISFKSFFVIIKK